MAIDRISAEALALLPRGDPGRRRFLMLGRQHLMLTGAEWRAVAERGSGPFDPVPAGALPSAGYAEPFLRWLGYGEIDSMDFSAYEGCTLVHDLNEPVPDEWEGRYDVVFDGGTLEHVFHFPQAIANAMRLVGEGGYFVGCTPSNHYNGHGFYQFSPELFYRIFEEGNGFRLRLLALAESTGGRALYRVADPKRAGHRVTFGGRGPTLLVVIAEKLKQTALFQSAVSQSDYAATWGAGEGAAAPDAAKVPGDPGGGNPFARLARRVLPASWTHRVRRYRAERERAKRGLRGVARVDSLRCCWLDSGE